MSLLLYIVNIDNMVSWHHALFYLIQYEIGTFMLMQEQGLEDFQMKAATVRHRSYIRYHSNWQIDWTCILINHITLKMDPL